MKRFVCLALLVLTSPAVRTQAPAQLPPVVVTELKALEETYVLLDQVADKVWPGWTGYREWPFKFEFENGLVVLVGHPNPPKQFEKVEGLRIGTAPVAVDRTRVAALPLTAPLSGGGGLGSFGMTESGAPVAVINIRLRMVTPADSAKSSDELNVTTERKVLIYLHELFHEFQTRFERPRVGNLQFNADTEYAVWSNIEGLALERAYAASDPADGRQRMKEFLVARAIKRRTMTEQQRLQESSDDVLEGTANYVMVRALEVIKAGGFTPKLTTADDPRYHGFADVDGMLAEYSDSLQKAASRHADPKMKCYDYGCFQALMCERLFPGWQKGIEKGEMLDGILAAKIAIADDERAAVEQRVKDSYPYTAVRADAAKFIDGRDAAWNQLKARRGRAYILDFKAMQQYVAGLADAKDAYRLGLITLYPSTYPGFKMDDIELSRTSVPAVADQLYYLKAVDTSPGTRKRAYSITGTKLADGTWVNATIVTPVFTIKAPKVRIRETAARVKIQVLARVRSTT